MENNANKKIHSFLQQSKGQPKPSEQIVSERDGLFERVEHIGKKLVTRDGKQLLTEESY